MTVFPTDKAFEFSVSKVVPRYGSKHSQVEGDRLARVYSIRRSLSTCVANRHDQNTAIKTF